MEKKVLDYIIQNQLELNFSYIPFINEGGLFIPTTESFSLGDRVTINLQLPGQLEQHTVESKVVWITPKNALYHVLPGIGVEFIGENAKTMREQIKANLDDKMDVGAYVMGVANETEFVKR